MSHALHSAPHVSRLAAHPVSALTPALTVCVTMLRSVYKSARRCPCKTQLMLVTEVGAFAGVQPSQIPGSKPALTPRDYFRQRAVSVAA